MTWRANLGRKQGGGASFHARLKAFASGEAGRVGASVKPKDQPFVVEFDKQSNLHPEDYHIARQISVLA
jgi:hypothetical protein